MREHHSSAGHLRVVPNTRRRAPRIRDRVEMLRGGIARRGTVHYADELQVLVKWDDGQSSSLRVERARLKILTPA